MESSTAGRVHARYKRTRTRTPAQLRRSSRRIPPLLPTLSPSPQLQRSQLPRPTRSPAPAPPAPAVPLDAVKKKKHRTPHGPVAILDEQAAILRLLRVEEHERDEHDDDDQELQETHADEQVGEEVLLHARVAGDAHHEGREELADAARAAADGHHGDRAAEHGGARVADAEVRGHG